MSDLPSISVVLPVHNGALWIRECVESLLAQRMPPTEVVVVDDGSRDDPASALRGLPVHLIRLNQNRGRAAARNAGIRVASGELIVFAEDDGYYPPEYLERIVEPFTDPGVAGSIGPCRVHRPDTFITRCRDAERVGHFAAYKPFTAWAYRAADLHAVGGFDRTLEFAEDVDLGRRIAQRCGRIAYVREAVWFHREPNHLSGFMRRRFRAGAGNLLYKLRAGRSPLPPRARVLALGMLVLAAAIVILTSIGQHTAAFAVLLPTPVLPLLARWNFVRRARRGGARFVHACGWVYLEFAGWVAAALGTLVALVVGPARMQIRLRGR